MPGPIHTRRLRLVACTLDMARAAIAGDVGRLLDVEVVSTWPEEGLRGFLPIYARQLEADSAVLGWGIWLVVHSAHGVLIGDAGFKGQPNDAGQVEIGYSVVERYRGHGYATEAAMALIEWAFSFGEVDAIRAECDDDNGASVGVLEKLGMRRTGSEGALLRWLLRRSALADS